MEADLVCAFRGQAALLSCKERTNRFLVLAKAQNKTAAASGEELVPHLYEIPPDLRQSLTLDNDSEMAWFRELERASGLRAYLCRPHSPWQRGTSENEGDLLRQYLPRGISLHKITGALPRNIAERLNDRPRNRSSYQSPAEVFNQARTAALGCCIHPQKNGSCCGERFSKERIGLPAFPRPGFNRPASGPEQGRLAGSLALVWVALPARFWVEPGSLLLAWVVLPARLLVEPASAPPPWPGRWPAFWLAIQGQAVRPRWQPSSPAFSPPALLALCPGRRPDCHSARASNPRPKAGSAAGRATGSHCGPCRRGKDRASSGARCSEAVRPWR